MPYFNSFHHMIQFEKELKLVHTNKVIFYYSCSSKNLKIQLHLQLARKQGKQVFIVILVVPKTVTVDVTESHTLVMHVKTPGGVTTVLDLVEIANKINASSTMVPAQALCEEGFWGEMCQDSCLYPGCYACDRYTGGCSVCKPNLWGQACDTICSPACPVAEDSNVYCNKLTGACDVGTCAIGYYGSDCTKECSSTCISNVCDFGKGSCTIGCLSGWWNPFCNETCGHFCVENKCTRDGQCDLHLGCVDGYAGFDCSFPCNETCIDGKCDRDLGRCFECTKEPPEERDFTCRRAGTH